MAVKYHCPKCERRFVEWGAKKLDFKCPDCENEELLLVTHGESTTTSAKPSLKRRPKKSILEDSPVFANTFDGDSDGPQFEGFSPVTGADADADFADEEAETPEDEIEDVETAEDDFEPVAESVEAGAGADADDEEEGETAAEEEDED